jgi:hypothetical protein
LQVTFQALGNRKPLKYLLACSWPGFGGANNPEIRISFLEYLRFLVLVKVVDKSKLEKSKTTPWPSTLDTITPDGRPPSPRTVLAAFHNVPAARRYKVRASLRMRIVGVFSIATRISCPLQNLSGRFENKGTMGN